MTSVRSPPSPWPTSTARSAVPGCAASIASSPSTIVRQAASHSGACMQPYPRRIMCALEVLTEPQLGAITHGATPLLVCGGPGTGKTEVLVRRLVWLADSGAAAPHEVLVLGDDGLR